MTTRQTQGRLEDSYRTLRPLPDLPHDDVVRRLVFLIDTMLSMVATHDCELDKLHRRIEAVEARADTELST